MKRRNRETSHIILTDINLHEYSLFYVFPAVGVNSEPQWGFRSSGNTSSSVLKVALSGHRAMERPELNHLAMASGSPGQGDPIVHWAGVHDVPWPDLSHMSIHSPNKITQQHFLIGGLEKVTDFGYFTKKQRECLITYWLQKWGRRMLWRWLSGHRLEEWVDDDPTHRTDNGRARGEKEFHVELAKGEMPVRVLTENSRRGLDILSWNAAQRNSNCEQTNSG